MAELIDGLEPWVKLKEAATHFRLSTRTVRELVASGLLKRMPRVRHIMISRVSILACGVPAVQAKPRA